MITRTQGKNNATFKANDFYKEYTEYAKEPLARGVYTKVREEIYSLLANKLYEEGSITFPRKFGLIEINKSKRRIAYNNDGTINKINYKVDWKKTKEYWAEKYPGLTPEELKLIQGKPKIYCDSEWRYKFDYIKRSAHYINKYFVWFMPVRQNARGLNLFMKANPHVDYKEK